MIGTGFLRATRGPETMHMKKLLITTFILIVTIPLFGKVNRGIDTGELNSLISEFNSFEGFEVVQIGRLGTTFIKALARLSSDGDEDIKDAVGLIEGVRKFIVIDYEDCDSDVRKNITSKIEKMLRDGNIILEAKDDGDTVKIYGVTDEKSDKIQNFVLYTPSDYALVCVFGSIPLESINSLID